ncbi:MAG TPA: glycosyltransferase family 4 protein [Coleofasciculaceae cyanobacterium]|jgi:UDP-N-acetylmuramyl pentapeptide phosphotransferase/UDP-N-acetylglucosamine-1-phosphate transferase
MDFNLTITSFLLSLLMVGLLKQYLSQHMIDIPNDRSSHTKPTPRGGGLGFIIAFVATSVLAKLLEGSGSALTSNVDQRLGYQLTNLDPVALWLILIPLAVIGAIDDRRSVPASIRYLVQLVAATLTVACFGAFPQPWLTNLGTVGVIMAIAFTLIGITALINFYNFMDGLDGLVAGVTAVQLGFLAYYLNQPIFWLLAAALLGFLWWNWSPAKIFMGDAGSTVLGASVALALLNTNNDPVKAWSALAVTLPLVSDALYTIVRRLGRGENIFKAHRTHLYQRLQQAGWSHAQVAIAYITATSMIILAITTLGLMGSWLSLVGVACAIAVGELYLTRIRSSASQVISH